MRIVPVVLLALACGPAIPSTNCRSVCGMELIGSDDCNGFQQAEFESLRQFEKHVSGVTAWQACHDLLDWRVLIVEGTWFNQHCNCTVSGEAFFHQAGIKVDGDKWHINSFAHELAHTVEWMFFKEIDYNHAGWVEKGYYPAILEAKVQLTPR